MVHIKSLSAVAALVLLALLASSAASLNDEQRGKVAAALKQWQALGGDPTVVAAVKEANANPPAAYKDMSQDKWKALSVLSPEIKYFSNNALATYLKSKRGPEVAELFVCAADGTKVAFFAKTTNWSHAGKAKHDEPMKGKTWIGDPELDDSTGKVEVQVSFPVLDGKKPIGSIVVGLDVAKL